MGPDSLLEAARFRGDLAFWAWVPRSDSSLAAAGEFPSQRMGGRGNFGDYELGVAGIGASV